MIRRDKESVNMGNRWHEDRPRASVVNNFLVCDPNIQPTGFNLS